MKLRDVPFGNLIVVGDIYYKAFRGGMVQRLATHEFQSMNLDREVERVGTYVIIAHDVHGFANIHAVMVGSRNPQDLFEDWWKANVTTVIGPPPQGDYFPEWQAKKQAVITRLIQGHETFQNLIVKWLVQEHKFLVLPHEELNFSQGF